jgi:PAS domain S-box-containing protein
MNFLAGGDSSRIDPAVRWWMLVRIATLGSILVSAMAIYDIPLAKPSPFSVLLSVSLLSVFVGILLAKFRVEKHAQLTFHSSFDHVAVFALVCMSGAASSPFSFLFVFVITASGALLGISGGIFSAAGASFLYALALVAGPRITIPGYEIVFTESEFYGGTFLLMDIGLHAVLYFFVGLTSGLLARRLQSAKKTVSELEGELKRVKLETRDILRNIGSGIFTCDLSERILYMNPAARKILSLEDEDPVGKPLSFLLKDKSPSLSQFVKRSIAGKLPYQKPCEFPMKLPSGETAIVGASTSLLRNASSQRMGLTVICQNITQKRELEKLSRKAQQMELMAEISSMLANEIAPPLSMVKNSLRVLAAEESRNPGTVKTIEELLEQLERVGRTLWDFQNFSRIRVAEWKQVFLGDVVRETFELLTHHPDFSSSIRIQVRGDVPRAIVWGDRELLKQVFMNLFIQAAKKMGSKGLVEVEFFPPLEPHSMRGLPVENGDDLFIMVQENGTVIMEEDLDYLGPSYTPSCFNGNGLRVAIVDRIVRAHMGKFHSEDVEGKGMKFLITLPLNKPV